MVKITLPLPSAKLSPNARLHWAAKAKAVKQHRLTAKLICSATGVGFESPVRFASYHLHFFWPDNRRRDRDNATARCKAYLDGIADAIGQDDSEWSFDGVRTDVDKGRPRLEICFEVQVDKSDDGGTLPL